MEKGMDVYPPLPLLRSVLVSQQAEVQPFEGNGYSLPMDSTVHGHRKNIWLKFRCCIRC